MSRGVTSRGTLNRSSSCFEIREEEITNLLSSFKLQMPILLWEIDLLASKRHTFLDHQVIYCDGNKYNFNLSLYFLSKLPIATHLVEMIAIYYRTITALTL